MNFVQSVSEVFDYLPVNSGVGGSGKKFGEGGWGKKNPFSKTALESLGESLTSCVGLE